MRINASFKERSTQTLAERSSGTSHVFTTAMEKPLNFKTIDRIIAMPFLLPSVYQNNNRAQEEQRK